MSLHIEASLVGGLVTFAGCVLMVKTQRWHAPWSMDSSVGVQKFHLDPTPRIAGMALLCGVFIAYVLSTSEVAAILGPMCWAGLPAFIVGFAEDLTKNVGVKARGLATFISGLLICVLTGVSLTHVGVIGVDRLLAWPWFAMVFTAFALAGLANAINIIDGFNGLAGGVVVVCLLAFAACATAVGDLPLAMVCLVLVGVVAGFMVINFPFGKIFLGDGGAYLLGFWLGWVAVLLPMRNPAVSPWASLLICSYPVLEVLFSTLRRVRRQMSPGSADRLHLHSLVKTRVVRKRLAVLAPVLRNAAVSPLMWLFAALPAGAATFLYRSQGWLMLAFGAVALGYWLLYRRLVKFSLRH